MYRWEANEKQGMVQCMNRHGFKKKHSKNYATNTRNDFFRGYMFIVGKYRPDLYEKKLTGWRCTQVCSSRMAVMWWCACDQKNMLGQKHLLCLKRSQKPQRCLGLNMNDLPKIEQTLQGNLWKLFSFLIALCDTQVKKQVKANPTSRKWTKNRTLWH